MVDKSPKVTVHGMSVINVLATDSGLAVATLARLRLAIELIDRLAPRVGTRLRQDVVAILLTPAGGTHYNVGSRAIGLDVRWAMSNGVEQLALTLVHEATHARHRSMGVGKRIRDRDRRMEAHCIAQQIEFAKRLPPGPWEAPTLGALDTPWWTGRARAGRIEELTRQQGISAWPFTWFARLRR